MNREWKPGDVAVTQFMGMTIHGIIDTDGRFYTTDQRAKGVSSSAFSLSNLRPLAVLDPDNRPLVQRLLIDFCKSAEIKVPTIVGTDAMQAALREFANPKPPRPEEPTGLGAVVEGANGTRWVRTDRRKPEHRDYRWTAGNGYLMWHEIDVVRVLSEGVVS